VVVTFILIALQCFRFTQREVFPYETVLEGSVRVLFQMNFTRLKFASPCIIIQFQQINQLDATIFQVYYLTFMYSSTCFGRPHTHHQELNNCSSSLWFYRWSVLIAVLLVVVGPNIFMRLANS
jgi:hypothetical protein